jgi:uncharacterized integral membrane protein
LILKQAVYNYIASKIYPLNKHERKISERRVRWKKQEFGEKLFQWSVWPGLVIFIIIAIYPDRQYNFTFIDYKIPLFGSVIAGMIVAAIVNFNRKSSFYLFIPFAMLFAAVFFFCNTTFADKKDIVIKEIINVKHHRYGRSGPHVEIKHGDFIKNIPAVSNEEVDSSSYVILRLNKGLFNYYLIKDWKLVKD